MTIHSLRPQARPDNLKNQMRASQSLARKIYLLALLGSAIWIVLMVFGPYVFMDADGMVVESTETVATGFGAQVIDLEVRPGDKVVDGQVLGHLVSTQMLDLISDVSSKKAQFDVREEQIKARLAAIHDMLPVAQQRVGDAESARSRILKALARGYSTTRGLSEIAREHYDALREVATLTAEMDGLKSESSAVRDTRERLASALDMARRSYKEGVVTSPVTGTVGTRVANVGSVLSAGATIADIHYGTKYALAYLPTNRFYSTDPGEGVIVTDGVRQLKGRLERIEAIATQLPAEFQSNFRSVERQQIARIAFDDDGMLPLLAKIKVRSPMAPSNLFTEVFAAMSLRPRNQPQSIAAE